MSNPRLAPFGAWASPIDGRLVARKGMTSRGTLSDLYEAGGSIYWRELRPQEGGRHVVMKHQAGGSPQALTPPEHSARTLVHEYGGGAFFVHGDVVFFCERRDQRLYRHKPGGDPEPITPDPPTPKSFRYADGRSSPDGTWIVCVRERHLGEHEVVNEVVVLPSDGHSEPRPLASGRDFYSNPRFDPTGQKLCWLAWDHPQMPWDGSELWVATFNDGAVSELEHVAGNADESIFQPEWSPEGKLHFVSDRTGWWNLYRWEDGRANPLAPMDAEVGSAQWAFGYSRYAFLSDGRIACICSLRGIDELAILDPASRRLEDIDTQFTAFNPAFLRSDGERHLWFVASGSTQPQSLFRMDTESAELTLIDGSDSPEVDAAYISTPEIISFRTQSGRTAHAIYYPPKNRDFRGPEGTRPPLIVTIHGGPTSRAVVQLHYEKQYWTSRGFALVDVNYGGSTGYGRAYRNRLKGQWGVVDVQDCIHAAKFLADQGRVDEGRLAIRGTSAGGYTTLCALTFHDEFSAGASYYGVADAEALATHTHKFEAHYLDSLIGPYPEAKELYRERSPIHHTQGLSSPLILFQGLEDQIVPPEQADLMVAALEEKGVPFAYLMFEGEQHGFRQESTIRRCLEAELFFYSKVFGFELVEPVEPIDIKNLPEHGA